MKDHLHIASGRILQRGLRPTPRHELLGAEPFRATATPPSSFFIFPLKMSMWLNDQYGDCVTAEEAFNKACNGVFIADATVMSWARANGNLNGADLQPVIEQMQSRGFSQDGNVYGDGAPLAVNYADLPTLQAAIYQAGTQGGSVKIGVAADELPSGAGNNNGWFMLSARQDSNEDHCMSACGYGTIQDFCTNMNAAFGLNLTVPSGTDPTTQGIAVYTWSTIGFATVKAFNNFVGEAWLRSPSSVNSGSGTPTPDKVYVSSTPAPTPTPIPVPPGPTPTPNPSPSSVTLTTSADLPAGTYTIAGPGSLVLSPALSLALEQELTAQKK